MKRSLIVFAKEPRKGMVKTRLSKYLSQRQCVSLYKALLKDSLDVAKRVKVNDKILAYDSEGKIPTYLSRVGLGFILFRQKGKSLGERMHRAILYASKKNSSRIIIIGSDCPTLSSNNVEKAFHMLDKKDMVLGPSYDGGYYLVGLRGPCYNLFKDIEWSGNKVFDDTIKKAKRLRKKVGILKTLYDTDQPEDIRILKTRLKKHKSKKNAKWTRKFLKV